MADNESRLPGELERIIALQVAYGHDKDSGKLVETARYAVTQNLAFPIGIRPICIRRRANSRRQIHRRSKQRALKSDTWNPPPFDIETYALFERNDIIDHLYREANSPSTPEIMAPTSSRRISRRLLNNSGNDEESVDASYYNNPEGGEVNGEVDALTSDLAGTKLDPKILSSKSRAKGKGHSVLFEPPKLQDQRYAAAVQYIQMGWGSTTPADNFNVSLSTSRQSDDGLHHHRAIIMKRIIPTPSDAKNVSSVCCFL